ncbi:MAG: response regulator transcription factor [Clostridia bacterium]|nr:response regulator transcription factor [Clostridia bacterium]
MFKILVVEDDQNLNRAICSYLNRKGYISTGCLRAAEAYECMDKDVFDLIITDIMMPGIDGYEFTHTIRSTDKEIPILFISARDDLYSKQKGFGMGIDDYMVKPINLEELILRVEALLRRAKIASSKIVSVGGLTMNMDERSTRIDGREVPMTAREFNILYKLLSYPDKTFTRSQLMDEFWESDTSSGPRTVDVYMAKIRDKFSCCDAFEIVTVHGLGYKVKIK